MSNTIRWKTDKPTPEELRKVVAKLDLQKRDIEETLRLSDEIYECVIDHRHAGRTLWVLDFIYFRGLGNPNPRKISILLKALGAPRKRGPEPAEFEHSLYDAIAGETNGDISHGRATPEAAEASHTAAASQPRRQACCGEQPAADRPTASSRSREPV